MPANGIQQTNQQRVIDLERRLAMVESELRNFRQFAAANAQKRPQVSEVDLINDASYQSYTRAVRVHPDRIGSGGLTSGAFTNMDMEAMEAIPTKWLRTVYENFTPTDIDRTALVIDCHSLLHAIPHVAFAKLVTDSSGNGLFSPLIPNITNAANTVTAVNPGLYYWWRNNGTLGQWIPAAGTLAIAASATYIFVEVAVRYPVTA